MPAITTIIAGVSAAAGLFAASQAQKQAKQQAAAAKKAQAAQAADAKLAASELAQATTTNKEGLALNKAATETGANVQFGVNSAADELLKRGNKRKTGTSGSKSVGSVGGL